MDYLRENWIAFTKVHARGNYNILLKDDQIHYQDCLRSFHPSSLLRSSSFYRPVVRTASLAIKNRPRQSASDVAQDQRPGGGEHYVHGVIVIRYGDDPDVAVATVAAVAQIDAPRHLA